VYRGNNISGQYGQQERSHLGLLRREDGGAILVERRDSGKQGAFLGMVEQWLGVHADGRRQSGGRPPSQP
jgi:hypothetical protein